MIPIIKNKKAQAAITDALFFLTIIVTLAVILFKFSATYGDRVTLATNNLYFKEYSNSALKTIFYAEIPLDFSKEISSSKETDYLMTAIKEDYFSDMQIGSSKDINTMMIINNSDISKYNLYNLIKVVMKPLPNYDYMFYLYNTNDSKFEFFTLKVTNFDYEKAVFPHQLDINATDSNYYLCDPLSYATIRDSFSEISDIYSSSIPLQFPVTIGDRDTINMTATFAIWPASVTLTKTDEENNNIISNFKCKAYTD
ncbi:MAG: hypothetical protein WCY27_00725 [archaeon]|jgi:hypothetical protein|nr:hypothetical protein [archaeon]